MSLDDFARRLADSQSSPTHLTLQDFTPPRDASEAMQVQAASLRWIGAEVGGFKLGFAADGTAIAGPMLQSTITPAPARLILPARGGLLAEVEIAFRLSQDLPRRERPYLRNEIMAHVGEVLIGIEWLCTRLDAAAAANFPAWLADRLGNHGYVTGACVSPAQIGDLQHLRTKVQVNGVNVHDKIGGHPQNDPLMPLLAYANAQNDALGGLKAGMVITTGSLITPLPITRPCEISAGIEGIGAIAASIVAA